MKPVRLAIIRQRYTPFGGAERFIDNAVQALGGQGGIEVSVITREWRGKKDTATGQGNEPRVVLCKPFHIGRVWRLWAFARAACRAVRDGDYDLVQSHERLACCDIFRAGDGVHREWLRQRERILPSWQRWLQRLSPFHRLVLAQERNMFASSRLKVVIANSRRVRDDVLRHYPGTQARIEVIYNGVDTERFHPRLRAGHRQAMRARHGIPEDAPLLLFVGSGFERKGLATVLHALAGLPESTRLIVVGKDRRSKRYQAMASRLGLGGRVVFAGPQRDVGAFYGMADLFVFPSLYDPFPNAALEAMASGLPVIVSEACGTADLIQDSRFVLDALDVTGWRDAIAVALAERSTGDQARQCRAVAESLALDKMGETMVRVYSGLLGGG